MSKLAYRRPAVVGELPLDRHSVIEASAGTGKTFAIEHLVLRILCEDRAALDEILVVTFTEKATADLRQRVRARIDKVLSGRGAENKADGDEITIGEEQRRRLEKALFSFERAPIHTIHGFCQRTLSELAFMTGAPFAAEIVDAQEAFHDAFRAELREGLAREPDWKILLDAWLETHGADSLESLLYEAYRLRYLTTDASRNNADAVKELIDTFDASILRADYGAAAIRADSRAPALAAFDAIESAIRNHPGDPNAIRIALARVGLTKVVSPTRTKNGKQFPAELSAKTRAFIAAAARAQNALPLEVAIADAMLPAVARRLAAQKRERTAMDYDDMLQWLAGALEGPQGGAVAAELRRRYKFALIDEFQDTDDLQWSIFRRVFVDPGESNVLCVIGDPKQAIYSFRGADVFSYLGACEMLRKGGCAEQHLRRNFRSTHAMLAALGMILDQDAADPILTREIPFDPDVTCGKPKLDTLGTDGAPVKPITLLEYEPINPRGDSVSVVRAALGRAIAAILRELLRADPPGIRIVDPDNRENPCRTVKARDVYVLTRTRAEAVEIGGYLREAGVPYAFYKREGLFQTSEAGDVLDVLRAIDDPLDRSRRLKAWNTPFFAVPYGALAGISEATATRLIDQLLEWRELAGAERFAELFDSLMNRSGLAYRELLFSNSERELTNYEHILEVLLEQALARRLSLAEIIELLGAYIRERSAPPGEDSNVERLESERAAVQIMTVHMSKGLEADVVVLFGGFSGFQKMSVAAAYHDPQTQQRVVALGPEAMTRAKELISGEREDEDRRLAYVALTRARAKLYLPMLAHGSGKRGLNGYYRFINTRLLAVAPEDAERSAASRMLERIPVGHAKAGAAPKDLRDALAAFDPPPALLIADTSLDGELRSLAMRRRALEIWSYTALDRSGATDDSADLEEFKIDPGAETAAPLGDDQLSGGRNVGLFLHEAIEHTDFAALSGASDRAEWSRRPEVREVIEAAMQRHDVNDPRWMEKGIEIVFNALGSPIAAGGVEIEKLASCENSREMEFIYPIPEAAPGAPADSGDRWRIERGILTGVVDLVFRHAGKTYFADWKSDRLAGYDPETVRRHVELNYALQAKIYTVGVVRMLGIRDHQAYEERFGGILYIFLRGIAPDGGGTRGIYFHRPRWEDVVRYERDLADPRRTAAELR